MNISESYKICKRCVMDTSDPEIVLIKMETVIVITNYFENISQKTYQKGKSEADLNELIEEIKEKVKSKYDCLIGVSGGIDSSYVAYLTHKYGLRTLTVPRQWVEF